MQPDSVPHQIDTSRPHPARMYNAYLGGKDNYPADRAAVAEVLRVLPEVRDIARANRQFLRRAVRFLTAEAGIRQIIDIGTGIPTAGNAHEVAAETAPGTRVVCVDNDPIVHAYANELLAADDCARIVLADLRDPDRILRHPAVSELIDFTKPVALLLVAIVHFLSDAENPAGVVETLRDALPPGSWLALSHATGDFHDADTAARTAAVYQRATAPLVPRTHAEILRFFDGFTLAEPGLVQAPLWRPDDNEPPSQGHLAKIGIYAGVGAKA